jgi:hypothetical protein
LQRGTLIDQRREFKLFEVGGGRFGVEGRRSVFEGKTTLRDLESAFSVPSLSAREKQRETTFSFVAWIPGATDSLDHQMLRCRWKLQVGHYLVQVISGDLCL